MAINNPYALQFNGSSSRVIIPKSSTITPSKNLTIMLNAYITTKNTSTSWLIANVESGGYGICLTTGGLTFQAYISSAYRILTSSLNNYSDGWYNIAATYDGSYLLLYLDGKEIGKLNYSGSISYNATAPLALGGNPNSSGTITDGWFNGKIDNISIWNKTLEPEEVNYYMNKKVYGNENGLVGHWALNEGSGNIIYDLTQNKNNGTIYNASWIDGEVDINTYDVEINNITISKTSILETDSSINLNCEVSHINSKLVQYKILINDIEILPLSILQPTPLEIDRKISTNNFILGENELKIIVFDQNGIVNVFKYIIVKENRDTFIFKRDFNFREENITDENININNGIFVKNIGPGNVPLNIITDGKSKIKSIISDSIDDTFENLSIDNKINYLYSLDKGNVYEYKIFNEYFDIIGIKLKI